MSLLFGDVLEIKLEDLRARTKVDLLMLGRDRAGYAKLEPSEVEAVLSTFDIGLKHLEKVAPKIAADIARQRQLALEFAAIAKATMDAKAKRYTFPPTASGLGVAWLFPQAIKYAATAETSYANNSWDIPLTAGTPAWLFGGGDGVTTLRWYRCSADKDKRSFILVFHNGIVEVGSTPSAEQFLIKTESKQDVGIYTVEPLVEINIEDNKAIYQYPTPGAFFVDHIKGAMWGFLPRRSGTATIKLLGLVYFEYDFVGPGFKWIT